MCKFLLTPRDRGMSCRIVCIARFETDRKPAFSGKLYGLAGAAVHEIVSSFVGDVPVRQLSRSENEDDAIVFGIGRCPDIAEQRGLHDLMFSGARISRPLRSAAGIGLGNGSQLGAVANNDLMDNAQRICSMFFWRLITAAGGKEKGKGKQGKEDESSLHKKIAARSGYQ